MCSVTTTNSQKGTCSTLLCCTLLYSTLLYSTFLYCMVTCHFISVIFLTSLPFVSPYSSLSIHLTTHILPSRNVRYCDAKPSAFGQKADVRGSSNEAELKLLIEGTVQRNSTVQYSTPQSFLYHTFPISHILLHTSYNYSSVFHPILSSTIYSSHLISFTLLYTLFLCSPLLSLPLLSSFFLTSGMVMIRRMKSQVLKNLPGKDRIVEYVLPDPIYVPEIKRIQARMAAIDRAVKDCGGDTDKVKGTYTPQHTAVP